MIHNVIHRNCGSLRELLGRPGDLWRALCFGAGTNINPGDIEAVAVDPGQDCIGPTINACHRVASVHCRLADKHPRAKLFGKIGPGSPRSETRHFGSEMRSKGEHVHTLPTARGRAGFRAVTIS
jgi:hypothetical protein